MLGVGVLAVLGALWYLVGRQGADELDGHNLWLSLVIGLIVWLVAETLFTFLRGV